MKLFNISEQIKKEKNFTFSPFVSEEWDQRWKKGLARKFPKSWRKDHIIYSSYSPSKTKSLQLHLSLMDMYHTGYLDLGLMGSQEKNSHQNIVLDHISTLMYRRHESWEPICPICLSMNDEESMYDSFFFGLTTGYLLPKKLDDTARFGWHYLPPLIKISLPQ